MIPELLFAVAMIVVADSNSVPAVAERTEASQLNSLLATWEAQSNRGDVIQIDFKRYCYDNVFGIQKRATGRLIFGNGKYRVDFDADKVEEGEKSQRDRYKLQAERSETWVQNGTNTRWIHHSSRHIDDLVHPADILRVAIAQKPKRAEPESFFRFRCLSFWDEHVPTFLRVQPDYLRRRYRIEMHPHSEKQTILILVPRGEPESSYWKSLFVLWDHELGHVSALKVTDPSRNYETVYVVTSYEIDPELEWETIWNPEYPGYWVKVHKAR